MNLSISQFNFAILFMSKFASINHSFFAELTIPQLALAIIFLSDLSNLFIPLPALLILLNIFVFTKILLLLFNEEIFYIFLNIFKHICNYLKGEKCIHLHLDIVKQALNNFNLGLIFVAGLIKVIKKDKKWVIEK